VLRLDRHAHLAGLGVHAEGGLHAGDNERRLTV
jgi:hypothetical protein